MSLFALEILGSVMECKSRNIYKAFQERVFPIQPSLESLCASDRAMSRSVDSWTYPVTFGAAEQDGSLWGQSGEKAWGDVTGSTTLRKSGTQKTEFCALDTNTLAVFHSLLKLRGWSYSWGKMGVCEGHGAWCWGPVIAMDSGST